MNKISEFLLEVLLVIVVLLGCMYAARVEYTDEVVGAMDSDKYEYIYSRIAPASQYDVAVEYMNNKEHYDSIKYY